MYKAFDIRWYFKSRIFLIKSFVLTCIIKDPIISLKQSIKDLNVCKTYYFYIAIFYVEDSEKNNALLCIFSYIIALFFAFFRGKNQHFRKNRADLSRKGRWNIHTQIFLSGCSIVSCPATAILPITSGCRSAVCTCEPMKETGHYRAGVPSLEVPAAALSRARAADPGGLNGASKLPRKCRCT